MANVTRLSETYYYKYTKLYGTLKIIANNSQDCTRCLQDTLTTKTIHWPITFSTKMYFMISGAGILLLLVVFLLKGSAQNCFPPLPSTAGCKDRTSNFLVAGSLLLLSAQTVLYDAVTQLLPRVLRGEMCRTARSYSCKFSG